MCGVNVSPKKSVLILTALAVVLIVTLSSFVVLYEVGPGVSATPTFLNVAVTGPSKIGVDAPTTYTATVNNSYSGQIEYTWSISPQDNKTLLTPLDGNQCNLTFTEATDEPYRLSCRALDLVVGNMGSGSLAVYDPYTSPNLYIGAYGAPYSYLVETDGKGWYRAINGQTGAIFWSSTDATSTILSAAASGGTIIVTSDITTTAPLAFTSGAYLSVDFMGHTITSGAGGSFAATISYQVDNGVFELKNAVIDNQNTVGDGVTAGATGKYPKTIMISKVTVNNFANHGFYFRVANTTTAAELETIHDIYLKDITANTTTSTNECLTVDNARLVDIENAHLAGNKAGYVVAAKVVVNGLIYDSTSYGFGTHASVVDLNSITGLNTGYLQIDPYTTIEGSATLSNSPMVSITNFQGFNTCRIYIRAHTAATGILQHIVLSKITQAQTPIYIRSYDSNIAQVGTLEINDLTFIGRSGVWYPIEIRDTSITNLVINSLTVIPLSGTYSRILYIENTHGDLNINAQILSVYPRPWPYIAQSTDSGNGYGITGTFYVQNNTGIYTSFWQLTSGTSNPTSVP